MNRSSFVVQPLGCPAPDRLKPGLQTAEAHSESRVTVTAWHKLTERPTSNVQRSTFKVGRWTLNVGRFLFCLVLCLIPFSASSASPDATTRAAMRLLKTECLTCHNQEKKKGGLILTARNRVLEGGDDGIVVVPGNPNSSLLAKVLVKDADPHMPPKKQLTDAQIKTLREWIKGGLNWNEAALQ